MGGNVNLAVPVNGPADESGIGRPARLVPAPQPVPVPVNDR
jgi:hypothetical protein